jgi:methylthioribulose-1-phosphate dehydratase
VTGVVQAGGVPAGVLEAAGRALAAESARFAAMGWMRGTSGNLSVVLGRDPLRLAVTVSGLDKGELTSGDVVVVDEHGRAVPDQPNPELPPSAEAALHARVAARTGAGAVVHVHSMAAVLAGHWYPDGLPLRDLEMLKGIGRAAHGETVTVPVVPNSQDMAEIAAAWEPRWDGRVPAFVVARHGMYAWGRDLAQARHHTEITEFLMTFAVETRPGGSVSAG